MILARISKAIREQNWFAVALEFIIVILGVVIGFQVTEWRASEDARATEQAYLRRLHEDMLQSRTNLEQELAQAREWNTNTRSTLNALLAGNPEGLENGGFELISATWLALGSPQRATLNELLYGGQMHLVRDPVLREQIAKTDAELTRLSDYLELVVQGLTPHGYQIQSVLRPVASEDFLVSYEFDELAQNDAFLNSLGHAVRMTEINLIWLQTMLDEINTLETMLATARGCNAGPVGGASEGECS